MTTAGTTVRGRFGLTDLTRGQRKTAASRAHVSAAMAVRQEMNRDE